MKAFISCTLLMTFSTSLIAKEIIPFDDAYSIPAIDLIAEKNCTQDTKIIYLMKLLEQQGKLYENKISFMETELNKAKERLIQKSMNQELIEKAMQEKYAIETIQLKKDLAYTTKSLLLFQRQMEKMKPSEDLKNIIKLNTELASQLRKSEDQIASMQYKNLEMKPGTLSGDRRPASSKDQN
jgi:hypothetical protein